MRVAHIIKVVRVAGAEQHLLALLPALRTRGIDAHIILLVEPSNLMESFFCMASERQIPIQRLVINSHLDIGLFKSLRDALLDLKPDIVHTHLLHADLYGIVAARWARVPVIITSRHNDNIFRRNPVMRLLNWTLWQISTGGIAISDAIRRFCIQVERASPDKITTIHYGLVPTQIDRKLGRTALRAELGLPANAVLMGIVCRLIEQKGVTYALQAFAQLAAGFPDAHLVIAGEGVLRPQLESEVITLAIKDRVHFIGWREDVTAVLAGLDMLLAPSLWEGFGLIFLEAMNAQLPIIASAVSAIPEIIVDGETGLLVPMRDVNALVGALNTLLRDAPLRQHMGLLGQDRLETHFTLSRMVDKTIALYQQLLHRDNSPIAAI